MNSKTTRVAGTLATQHNAVERHDARSHNHHHNLGDAARLGAAWRRVPFLLVLLCGLMACGAQAATYTVNTNGDATGSCAASGTDFPCNTLRAAITATNATAANDTISINTGVAASPTSLVVISISISTALPSIAFNSNHTPIVGETLTITGSNQAGFDAANRVPVVVLQGPGAGTMINGLATALTNSTSGTGTASNIIISGLSIVGFHNGITFFSSGGNMTVVPLTGNAVTGCYLGILPDGTATAATAATANVTGVLVTNRIVATIGGLTGTSGNPTPGIAPGNVISGNTGDGVSAGGAQGNTRIVGNYIGSMMRRGLRLLPNRFWRLEEDASPAISLILQCKNPNSLISNSMRFVSTGARRS